MQVESDNEEVHTSTYSLVHFGAGRCNELSGYLDLQPQRILLVEADPELAEDLKKRTAFLEQVQVQCAAVAGNPGPVTFYRYNLPHAGSLHSASGMLKLYPGLRVVEKFPMEAVSPNKVLEPLHLEDYQENHWVIDIPGEELQVLQSLLRTGQLHLFFRIQLYCGREPLYENSEPSSRILEWLQENERLLSGPDGKIKGWGWGFQEKSRDKITADLDNSCLALETLVRLEGICPPLLFANARWLIGACAKEFSPR